MKIIVFTFICLFSFRSYSALYGYCLEDGVSPSTAINYLNDIRSPRDKFFSRGSVNCLEVRGNPKMFGLYYRYLSGRFKVLRTYKGLDGGGSNIVSRASSGMCQIIVTKSGNRKSTTDTIDLSRRSRLKRTETKGESKSISSLVLTYGKKGSLRVNQEEISITCKKSGSGHQISIQLISGSSSLASSVFVSRGQSLNLGSIVNSLDEKRRTISISKGLEYQKTRGNDKFDYFLVIK